MNSKKSARGGVTFFFLLMIMIFTINGLRYNLASDSVNWIAIKSNISLSAKYPEEYGDFLNFAEETWVSVRFYCQISALVLGIVSFLMGVIIMHWINKMGMRESLKGILGYIIFATIIILIVEFISHFLL